jgi:ATP-dependent RNA helicase DDX3X
LKVSYKGKDIFEKNDITNFDDLSDLDPRVKLNLKMMKFDLMTPIQKAVIPYMSRGYDVMGCSQTGSGKTIAFLLPVVNKMLKEGAPSENYDDALARPVTLILIPTRELAEQIYKESRKLVHKTGINVVKIYGGVSHYTQIR